MTEISNPGPDPKDTRIENLVYTNKWIATRIYNSLGRQKIFTLGDLYQYTTGELLEIPDFGATCLAEVTANLNRLGLGPLRNNRWSDKDA